MAARKTMADLDQVLGWLADLTGRTYRKYPLGSGVWSVCVLTPDGQQELASKPLRDLIPFLDAYRRGYGAARDDARRAAEPSTSPDPGASV